MLQIIDYSDVIALINMLKWM